MPVTCGGLYTCPVCDHGILRLSNGGWDGAWHGDEVMHWECFKRILTAENERFKSEIDQMRPVVEAAYPFIIDAGIHWEDDDGMTRQYCGYCCAHTEWFPVVGSEPETDINGNLPMAHAEICIAENARKLFNALNVDAPKEAVR